MNKNNKCSSKVALQNVYQTTDKTKKISDTTLKPVAAF
jgi:hypothetical protein